MIFFNDTDIPITHKKYNVWNLDLDCNDSYQEWDDITLYNNITVQCSRGGIHKVKENINTFVTLLQNNTQGSEVVTFIESTYINSQNNTQGLEVFDPLFSAYKYLAVQKYWNGIILLSNVGHDLDLQLEYIFVEDNIIHSKQIPFIHFYDYINKVASGNNDRILKSIEVFEKWGF